MKKLGKKLQLARETVAVLQSVQLRVVQGGRYTGPAPSEVCSNPYYDKNCSGFTLDCWSTGCG